MILFALKLQVARKLVLWQAFSFDHSLIVEKVSSRESFTFKNVIHLIKLMTKSAFILKLDGLALLVTDPPNANFTSRISSPICDPPFIIHKAWYQLCNFKSLKKKSLIRETKNLSTDADSSTDTTVGWTKNTQKPNFFEKRKKLSKTEKLKNV